MLNLYQELVPFSNKRLDKSISSSGAYSNPVIMSFAFDFTVCSNILETVLYIRNDSETTCYSNVVVSLMKIDKGISNPVATSGLINEVQFNGLVPSININGTTMPLGYSVEQIPTIPAEGIPITSAYMSNYVPVLSDINPDSGNSIYTDDKIGVKFSYGYDELSDVEWGTKHSALCIPTIGLKSTPENPFGTSNTEYHAIRMRMTWKAQSTLLTIRDYFIDVSYERGEPI